VNKEKAHFDGDLRYVCPHCRKEQRFVEAEFKAGEVCATGLWTYGQTMRYFEVLVPYLQAAEVVPLIPVLFCPGCRAQLRKEEIQGGFLKWLGRLRKGDPKRIKGVMAWEGLRP